MFTGLVQEVGAVAAFDGRILRIAMPKLAGSEPLELGESIAVNGCCLTLAMLESTTGTFHLSEETLSRTTLGTLAAGDPVNLERALRVGDRLGGHFIQGHVDGLAELVGRDITATDTRYRIRVPAEGARLLIDKGSVALDGVSLTVIHPEGPEFEVSLVPHTLAHTTLGRLGVGAKVNCEFDMLAKHVQALLAARS